MKQLNGFTVVAVNAHNGNILGAREDKYAPSGFEYVVTYLPEWQSADHWGQGHYFRDFAYAVERFNGITHD